MADSDQILQLGIDEARNGNREAARNLFELLTRQEPNNAQGWLWLAGVADGTDQRREALQRVLALEPENEMARKGLQAMGVAIPAADAVSTAPTVAAPVEVSEPVRPRSNDEAFADELDLAFSDDYSAIPRAEAPPRDLEAEVGSSASGSSSNTSRRSSSTATDRPTLRRPSPRVRTPDPMGDDDESVRRGPSPLLWALAALIAIVLIIFIALNLFRTPDTNTANQPTAITSGQVTPGALEPTPAASGATNPTTTGDQTAQPTAGPNAPQPTVDPNAPQPTVDPNAPQPTADPNAQPTAVPAPQATVIPAENANPAPVGLGTVLQADGWNYTYPQANYAVALGNQVGGQTAQGSFVHVLAWVANSTGRDQVLPADFFVLRDSQGKIYSALPKVSSALVVRGQSADIGMEDNVPANGLTTSVYLVFDVPPGVTDLVLFARNNPSQGFKVLDRVP